jgi:hemerythrin superfamily protein
MDQHSEFKEEEIMNALELLIEDHQKVAQLLDLAEETEDDKEKQKLFEQIKTELEAHAHIEETIFYPALREHEELKDLVLEAFEEHKQVKTLLREISELTDGSEKFGAKLKVMKENVEHHVDEEEGEMFPQVEDLMGEEQLERLGMEMEAAKNRFSKSAGSGSSR